MLSSGRHLAAITACALERRAAGLTCVASTSSLRNPSPSPSPSPSSLASSGGAAPFRDTAGARRQAQSGASAGDDKDSPASSPTSGSPAAPSGTPDQAPPTTAPLRAPTTSPEAQALADKLRQSSPTGRLLDLFAPQGPGRGPRPGAGPPLPGALPTRPSDAAAAAAAGSETTAAAAAPTDADVVRIVLRAVENCKPLMKVQQNKGGNKIVYVPKPLDPAQSTNFAVKWILQAAEKRRDASRGAGASMAHCLALELLLAYQRKGAARAKRDEVHKLALDNRANLRARLW